MSTSTSIQPRMPHVVRQLPDAFKALLALSTSAQHEDVPRTTRFIVHLRASQINGCSHCTEMHARELKEAGEPDEKIWTVAAWREAPYFTGAERAALALTESLTRIADNPDAVPDEIWDEAARHYDESALAALIVDIAAINVWNRLNVATREPAGTH
jgi:AhpD family alkylhydroperoxidase